MTLPIFPSNLTSAQLNNSPTSPNVTLSMLWIFIVVNFFARDFHELGRPGMLEQMMSGTVGGVEITEALMLLGGVMIEIPMLMIVLPLLLERSLNRVVNLGACALTAAIIALTNLHPDLDNIFFMVFQLIGLAVIARLSWRWKSDGVMLGSS